MDATSFFPTEASMASHSQDNKSAAASHASSPPFTPKRRRSSAVTKATDDVETCRICRGEATASESLFYPCKCSGSIKYVHQDCLMEWLSHSQKKYCELCKTPFRFTKLYHPHMPSSLPTTVFVRRALLHIASWLLIWARAALVGTVWLIALPYAMRVVWRTLYWLADGGWARDKHIGEIMLQSGFSNSTVSAPDFPVLADTALQAINNASTDILPQFLKPLSHSLNMTNGAPLVIAFFGRMLSLGIVPNVEAQGNATAHELLIRRMDSLLSDVSMLQRLTRWPGLNRLIIDVLEGLIISLSVVVAFILVFLIREWVVQQQPLLNVQVEENNPAAAAEEQAAEVVGHVEEEEDRPASEAVEAPESPQEDYRSLSPGPSDVCPTSTVTTGQEAQAQAAISQLPGEMQQAIREKRRLQDVAQVIKTLPPEEVVRVKQVLSEWSNVHNGRSINEDEGSQPVELPAEHVEPRGSVLGSRSTDNMRPSLSRQQSALAYEFKRNMEEEHESSSATPYRSHEGLEEREKMGGFGDKTSLWANIPELSSSSSQFDRLQKGKQKASSYSSGEDETNTLQKISSRSSSFGPLYQTTSVSASDRAAMVPADVPASAIRNTTSSDFASIMSPPSELPDGRSVKPEQAVPTVNGNVDLPGAFLKSTSASGHDHTDENWLRSYELANPSNSTDQAAAENATVVDSDNSGTAATQTDMPLAPSTFYDPFLEYIYGDLRSVEAAAVQPDQDDEHVVQDLADEAPFVPFAENQPALGQVLPPINEAAEPNEVQGLDPEVAAAAAEAGIDVDNQDAIEEAEDLEGMLELIGMRGPITGLFQNALFSAVLISITISAAVWLPYCAGKLILLLIRTPIGAWFEVPIMVISVVENFIADLALFIFAGLFYLTTASLKFMYTVSMGMDPVSLDTVLQPARRITGTAFERLGNATLAASLTTDHNDHDYLYASMAAHASLKGIQQDLRSSLGFAYNTTSDFFVTVQTNSLTTSATVLTTAIADVCVAFVKQLLSFEISLPKFVAFDAPEASSVAKHIAAVQNKLVTLDPALAFWSARDRTLTAGLSYLTLAMVGCFYLSLSPPLFRNAKVRKVEQHVTDILTQAGGVLKVILIISIEMIAFPLFCGFLLDLALLPLFENATISTRIAFAISRPWTSGFVHWFVGTCYMFHFALFVSMCRKIMRTGVLYFIRDPDDPTFHPVRDVLERSVATQLRKIAFSAIVYGALIVLCLGGVVWGLWAAFNNVLPLHWSSSKSALEFPLDILFYNFLTPLVLRHAKPSDSLHAMYKWWFRRCARFLRLSDFLFGERLLDEEGYRTDRSLLATSLRYFNPEQGASTAEPRKEQAHEAIRVKNGDSSEQNGQLANDAHSVDFDPAFKKTGRYVRAPATDQVRIPKGEPVFVPVTEDNRRLDNKPEDEGVHARSSNQTRLVYVPPWFTLRISAFVITIWLFAAVTGCGITIVPLIAGRWMIATVGNYDADTKINDIYAFSLGIYTLGGLLYLAMRSRQAFDSFQGRLQTLRHSISPALFRAAVASAVQYGLRVARIVYVWSALIFGLPLILAALLELYLLVPLHTLSADVEQSVSTKKALTEHTIHLVQDWTLGVLYSHIVVKLILWDADSLLAKAAHAVTAEGGIWNPDAKLATRYFILPFSLLFGVVIGAPFLVAQIANRTVFAGEGDAVTTLVSRLSYPLCSGLAISLYMGYLLTRATERWRGRIKDEVYLIGERLHNFGERKAPGHKPTVTTHGTTSYEDAATGVTA